MTYQQALSLAQTEALFDLITKALHLWLVPNVDCNRIGLNMTLQYLSRVNQRVFLVCNDHHHHHSVWWMNTLNLNGDATNLDEEWALLDAFLKGIKYARNIGRSFREITLNLVPDEEDDVPILKTIFRPNDTAKSSRQLAEEISTHMYERLEQIDVKLFRKVNFVSIDFVDRAFIEWVIRYNIAFRGGDGLK